jgi:nuclear migration protein JNM1
MARLRREIEEVREEARKREFERKNAAAEGEQSVGVKEDDVVELGKMLSSISTAPESKTTTAGKRLVEALQTPLEDSQISEAQPDSTEKAGSTTYTVTYAPSFEESHALAKAADFDTRLALLEKVLGITSTTIPILDVNGTPQAIIPTLDILQRQVTTITTSSASTLDNVSRRIRTLTQEAERLEEARRSAKAAQDALKASGRELTATNGGKDEDSEQLAKINALYGTLPTIEKLAPLLPALLERLRSLRAIHADAATASERLEGVERGHEQMASEIKKWRESLEKVEGAMKENEGRLGGNMKVVEGWVKDLEERMQKLGA